MDNCLQSRLVYGISLLTNRAAFPPVKQMQAIDFKALIVALVDSCRLAEARQQDYELMATVLPAKGGLREFYAL